MGMVGGTFAKWNRAISMSFKILEEGIQTFSLLVFTERTWLNFAKIRQARFR
jgi:hypothetical protein